MSKTVKWNDFNRLLCPVRALKRYLKVTEPIRLNRKRLFLPLKGNHDITKGSISGWITYTIRLAYKNVSKSKVALEPPIICYKYNKPIRNTIFNFNKLVSDLDIHANTPKS